MKLKAKHYVACDSCGLEFYGPDAGVYDGWDPESAGMSLEEFLIHEAMSMMWIRVVWGVDDVLLCSSSCVNRWLEEVRAGGC